MEVLESDAPRVRDGKILMTGSCRKFLSMRERTGASDFASDVDVQIHLHGIE